MPALPLNNAHSRDLSPLEAVLWPLARVGEAMHALAQCAGLPSASHETFAPSADLTLDELNTWMSAAGDRSGIHLEQVVAELGDIPALALRGAPLLLRVRTAEGEQFLAIAGSKRGSLVALGPDLLRRDVPLTAVCACIQRPFEEPHAAEIDDLLDKMRIPSRRRTRARRVMMARRLGNVRLRTCWLLRLPTGSPLRDEIRETRLTRGVAVLVAAHVVQYLLFVLSWWLLGRGVMRGTIDSSWLLGWILLLISLVPFRLLATWTQGVVSTTVGAGLRRRLLRGALRVNRGDVRRKGAGQLFGVVVEAAAIESLALTGGMAAGFAFLELGVAAAVLWMGTGLLHIVLLTCWIAAATALGWRYVRKRAAWTEQRLSITNQLLESMLGHRTRLAQQPSEQWHPQEDALLARYIEGGRSMDRSSVWLTAFIPRGWLVLALGALAPAVMAQAEPERIGIAVGGILLAFRSLKGLSHGLSNLAGAAIAGRAVAPLVRSSSIQPAPPHPSMVISRQTSEERESPLTVQARSLSFSYSRTREPVLHDCSLSVPRGTRWLIEGESGAGKTTLASILAGLEAPDSGLLLVDGLDHSVLGKAGWQQRVVMAPQAHDNYIVSGSLAFNLLMGRRWPARHDDLAEAEQVCRELGLGELLDRLPGGLHQMVGETGWQLSQGERTRVFLARALLQKPEVLVLDESFSALDPENVDRTIRCVLRRASTVVAAAHT